MDIERMFCFLSSRSLKFEIGNTKVCASVLHVLNDKVCETLIMVLVLKVKSLVVALKVKSSVLSFVLKVKFLVLLLALKSKSFIYSIWNYSWCVSAFSSISVFVFNLVRRWR